MQQCSNENAPNNSNDNNRPAENDRQKYLLEHAMQVGDVGQRRILSFQDKAPPAPDSHLNPIRVIYSIKTPSTKSGCRYIPTTPERILDAPDIINDYCE